MKRILALLSMCISPVLFAMPSVDGNTITFPDDGDRYKVFDRDARINVCYSFIDGLSCMVEAGNYRITNLDTGAASNLTISEGMDTDPNSITLIDFESLVQFDQLTDQLLQLGVIFEGTDEGNLTSGLVGMEPDRGTFNFGNSEPIFILVGTGELTIKFVDPNSQQPDPVDNVSFRAGDADVAAEAFGVTAFGLNGVVLGSEFVHLFESGATINLPYQGIAEIRIFGMNGCRSCGSGFAIDDLSFSR